LQQPGDLREQTEVESPISYSPVGNLGDKPLDNATAADSKKV
jgi:hypothetical protein